MCLFISSCTEKRLDIVESPRFDSNSSATLEIEKIEFSDDASVFHFLARGSSGESFLIVKETYIKKSGDKGKFIVRSAEGITLDEFTTFSESGIQRFTLAFSPLPHSVTKIDFHEGDCADCFKIIGIEITKRPKYKKTIEKPAFNAVLGPMMEIEKVDLTDTATVLHMKVYCNPGGWIRLFPDIYLQLADSGRLFIRDMDGLDFRQQLDFSESGENTFKMIFPAIPEKTEKINLFFGSETNGFNILGVTLNSKLKQKEGIPPDVKAWIENELKQAKVKTMIDPVTGSFFSRDTARIIGYLKGYDTKLGFTNGMIYIGNEITREDYPIVVQIYEDGRFEGAIPMNYPTNLSVVFNNNWIPFYIEPGLTLAMIYDWKDFILAGRYGRKQKFSGVSFQGAAAAVNTEMTAFNAQLPQLPIMQIYEEQKNKNADEFKEFIKVVTAEYKNKFDELLNKEKLSDKTRKILLDSYKIKYATYLMDYEMDKKYEGENLTLEFFDFLHDIEFDDKELLSTPEFSIFINRFEYSGIFNAGSRAGVVSYAYFKKTPAERATEEWRMKDSVYLNTMKFSPGIVYEVVKVRSLDFTFGKMLNDNKEDAKIFLEYIKESIKEPFLKEEAERLFEKNFPDKRIAKELPDTKEAKIFKDIITRHKGKILLVDFWATTCGPCVYAIKQHKTLREKYKGSSDADFIFITSEDESPFSNYENFVKEQELEHTYRLNPNDYRYLRQLFKFNGIPKYIIVDRESRIWNEDANSYTFEEELKLMLEMEKAN